MKLPQIHAVKLSKRHLSSAAGQAMPPAQRGRTSGHTSRSDAVPRLGMLLPMQPGSRNEPDSQHFSLLLNRRQNDDRPDRNCGSHRQTSALSFLAACGA